MSFYEITGGRPLEGRLAVQGSKNSVLPILAAAILIPGESVIHNCPHLSDVDNTLDILRLLGCQVLRDGTTVRINASHLTRWDIPDRLVREMRGSVVFLGSLLARLGAAQLCYPGGCELGPRPRSTVCSTAWAAAPYRAVKSVCPSPAWGPRKMPCWPPAAVRERR